MERRREEFGVSTPKRFREHNTHTQWLREEKRCNHDSNHMHANSCTSEKRGQRAKQTCAHSFRPTHRAHLSSRVNHNSTLISAKFCEREREGLRASLTRRIRARKPMTRRDNHRARHRFARTIANQSRESLPETTRREKTYPLFILVIWRVCE